MRKKISLLQLETTAWHYQHPNEYYKKALQEKTQIDAPVDIHSELIKLDELRQKSIITEDFVAEIILANTYNLWGVSMATKVTMKHKDTGIMKDGYFGFSWTTLLFGFFPALFRSDFITFLGGFVITLILGLATYGIAWLVIGIIWAFMYNKNYTRKLLEQGYIFADSEYKNIEAAEALGILPKRSSVQQSNSEGSNRKCPFCAEIIKAEAIICRFCGRDLPNDEQTNADTAFGKPEWLKLPDENISNHTHSQNYSDKWNDLCKYLSDPIEKRGLRILTGLFVGICSGYIIVAIFELIFGFYGIISNILTGLFTAIVIFISLRKSVPVDKLIFNLHAVNAILFATVAIFYLLYSVFRIETHPILATIPITLKIYYAIQSSLKLSIPGIISLFFVLKLKSKIAKVTTVP